MSPPNVTPEEHVSTLLAAHDEGAIPGDKLPKLREHLSQLARDPRVPEHLRLRAACTALDLDPVIANAKPPAPLALIEEEFCGSRIVLELVEELPRGADLRVQVPRGYTFDRFSTAFNRVRGLVLFDGALRAG